MHVCRPIGSSEELERRRRRAIDLVRQGERPTVVARFLGVDRSSVYRWRRLAAHTFVTYGHIVDTTGNGVPATTEECCHSRGEVGPSRQCDRNICP